MGHPPAQDNLIATHTAYAVDRAALSQLVADTLEKYDISITDAATGNISHEPLVPGLHAPRPQAKPKPLKPAPANANPNPGNSVQPAPPAQ